MVATMSANGIWNPDAAREAQTNGLPKYAMALETPYGLMALVQRGDFVSELRFSGDVNDGEILQRTPLLEQAAAELAEYFAGKRTTFTVPLAPLGTPFQVLIWQTLAQTVPYGQTVAYGELAKRAGRPLAARAVGMANHDNPLPIFIPCHRVIGANGKLVGFGGGLPLKQSLLAMEAEHARP